MVEGYNATFPESEPKNLIAGMITSQEITPPANSVPETRGPMM